MFTIQETLPIRGGSVWAVRANFVVEFCHGLLKEWGMLSCVRSKLLIWLPLKCLYKKRECYSAAMAFLPNPGLWLSVHLHILVTTHIRGKWFRKMEPRYKRLPLVSSCNTGVSHRVRLIILINIHHFESSDGPPDIQILKVCIFYFQQTKNEQISVR